MSDETIADSTEVSDDTKHQESRNVYAELKASMESGKIVGQAEVILEQENLQTIEAQVEYPVYDMSDLQPEKIVELIKHIGALDVVFTGSVSEQPYNILDPSVSKLSGKPQSIYGSSEAVVGLANAVLNKNGIIRDMDAGVGISSSMQIRDKGKQIFEAPYYMYTALQNPDQHHLFRDGYLYVTALSDWQPSQGDVFGESDHEYNSQEQTKPLLAIKIPAEVGKKLLVTGEGESDTVRLSLTKEQVDAMVFEKFAPFIDEVFPEERAYSAQEILHTLSMVEGGTDRLSSSAWHKFKANATDEKVYSKTDIIHLLITNREPT